MKLRIPHCIKVGQASSPDVMMTSGDACPTFVANFKTAQLLALIQSVNEFGRLG